MDTSGAVDGGLRATALLYSGRPDPEWDIDPERAGALRVLLAAAPPTDEPAPVPPPLGYHGVSLTSGDGEVSWLVYAGVIVELRQGGPPARRGDPTRAIERATLATAPPATLPVSWLEGLL